MPLDEIDSGMVLCDNFITIKRAISGFRDYHDVKTPIYFCVLDSKEFNAVSIKSGDLYFIAITRMMLQSIEFLWHQLNKTNRLFYAIDGLYKEKREPIDESNFGLENRNDGILKLMNLPPYDVDIEIGAKFASEVSLRILVYHELGHIVFGHLNGKHGTFHAEIPELQNVGDPSYDLACEFEADTFAVQIIYSDLANLIGKDWDLCDFTKDSRNVGISIAYGLYCLFMIFDGANIRPDFKLEGVTHPHPITRYISCCMYLDRLMRANLKEIHRSSPGTPFKYDGFCIMQDGRQVVGMFEEALQELGISALPQDDHKRAWESAASLYNKSWDILSTYRSSFEPII